MEIRIEIEVRLEKVVFDHCLASCLMPTSTFLARLLSVKYSSDVSREIFQAFQSARCALLS